jgi:Zn-dependent M28 family amino/carboxypeptidase
MGFLAGDLLNGRGPATRDEHLAALYAAARFASMGLEPAGDNSTFLQKTALPPEFQRRLQKFQAVPDKTLPETWNAIAVLRGTAHPDQVIVLSAHLDALGLKNGLIYNGADDDASGTAAVLSLAQFLSSGPRPQRTILFALFDAEEIGGAGDRAFLAHPAVPLTSIITDLNFEMIGRPDPQVARDTLWLTGFERTTLGPQLACHGAHLAPDPHPAQHFFQRSDNFALAKRGVIAQTISSYDLHTDYHQPSDKLSTIDFNHLAAAVDSVRGAILWLANTTWRPTWNPGQKP